MSIVHKLDGTTLDPKNVFLHWGDEEGFEGTAAADGTGSFGSVTFHDPDGTLDVRGWMSYTIDETDCVSAPRLVTSWIWTRDIEMGDDELAPAARKITCQLLDPNAMLSLRVITGGDAMRPDETDTERVAWLLASDYLDGIVADTGFVDGEDRDFDADNLHGKYPAEVINDLCGPRGRIFFAFWDQTAEAVGLFYDDPTATTYTSTLTISNVPSDASSTCFPPFDDAKLSRDPSDVYSHIRYVYKGGVVYRNNAATAATFFASPLLLRGLNVENKNVGKRSTAIRFADRILTQKAQERDEIIVTIRVPSTQIGLIDAGMRLGIRNTRWALEGYGSLTYTRVERRTFKQAEGRRGFYDVTLTLSNHGLGTAMGTGPGSTDGFPYDPPVAIPMQTCLTLPGSGISASSTDEFLWPTEQYRGVFTGAPSIVIDEFSIAGYIASNYCLLDVAYSWDGGAIQYAPVQSELTAGHGGPGVFTGQVCWNGGSISQCQGDDDGTPYPSTPVTFIHPSPGNAATLRVYGISASQNDSVGPVTFCVTIGAVTDAGTALVVPNDALDDDETEPESGKVVTTDPEISADGIDDTFASVYPFAPSSVVLLHDEIDQTDHVTTWDYVNHTAQLDYVPDAGSKIRYARYVSA